jgi:hypothetical protein
LVFGIADSYLLTALGPGPQDRLLFHINLRSDHYLLAVAEGDFIAVKDSSTQNILAAKHSDRYPIHEVKVSDLNGAEVNRCKNRATVSHFHGGATIEKAQTTPLQDGGDDHTASIASIKKSEGFLALSLYLYLNR